MDYNKAVKEVEESIKAISEGRVVLVCNKHGYAARRHKAPGGKLGGIEPPASHGCPGCWDAYYKSDFAITPAHMRMQRLDELEGIIHRMVEASEKGTWDFKPEDHAEITFIPDGFDDEKQDYKEDS